VVNTTQEQTPPGAVKRPLSLEADSHPDHIISYNCGDDFGLEAVAFIGIHEPILPISGS
jgi:hypothetical protein